MSERKILMIINFFPPTGGGGVYRPLAFVKYLSRLAWKVTVVTPQSGEFWISDHSLLSQVPPEVRVVKTPSLSGLRILNTLTLGRRTGSKRSSGAFGALRNLGEFFLLPDSYIGWIPFAVEAARKLCHLERFDVLYSTSPPDSSHLAALKIRGTFAIPWVADFRDPWINLYLRKPATPLHQMMQRRMERRVAGADCVLVTTRWHEEKLRESYPGIRIERIPNGYDEEDFHDLTDSRPPAHPFTILHSGMLTLGRSSRPFLEGLSRFCNRSPEFARELRVTFLGARESENEAWVQRFGLEGQVVFEDNIPHHECVRRECNSHILLLIKHDDERYRGLVPGKLFEYIGARRPVLAVVPEGEARDTILSLNRGEIADVQSPEEIADKLSKMFRLSQEGRLDDSYVLDDVPTYSRRMQTARLNEILERILEER